MFLTKEEIGRLEPDQNGEYLYEGRGDDKEYVSITVTGARSIGEKIFGVDLDSERYENAWIDVYAQLKWIKLSERKIGVCDRMYFRLVANTGRGDDNRDVFISFTNVAERQVILDQLTKDDEEVRYMLDHLGEE